MYIPVFLQLATFSLKNDTSCHHMISHLYFVLENTFQLHVLYTPGCHNLRLVLTMQHLQKGCSKSGHGVIFATKVRVFADVRRSAEFQTSVASRLASLFTRTSMHYGFSYHFSGNGTYFFQINIVTSIVIENC